MFLKLQNSFIFFDGVTLFHQLFFPMEDSQLGNLVFYSERNEIVATIEIIFIKSTIETIIVDLFIQL